MDAFRCGGSDTVYDRGIFDYLPLILSIILIIVIASAIVLVLLHKKKKK